MDSERTERFYGLIGAHQGAIRKVAALYARDKADREDLFQEIALQLWRSFDGFRGEAAFSTFLYRVALNTALLRVRRAQRKPQIDSETPVELLESPAPGVPDEDVEQLYAAIRQLKPIDRAIVMLVLEERSYAEIASVTGLTEGNVGVRLSRSKVTLRQLLGESKPVQEARPCSTKN